MFEFLILFRVCNQLNGAPCSASHFFFFRTLSIFIVFFFARPPFGRLIRSVGRGAGGAHTLLWRWAGEHMGGESLK